MVLSMSPNSVFSREPGPQVLTKLKLSVHYAQMETGSDTIAVKSTLPFGNVNRCRFELTTPEKVTKLLSNGLAIGTHVPFLETSKGLGCQSTLSMGFGRAWYSSATGPTPWVCDPVYGLGPVTIQTYRNLSLTASFSHQTCLSVRTLAAKLWATSIFHCWATVPAIAAYAS